jgi:copper(I)-binding protein
MISMQPNSRLPIRRTIVKSCLLVACIGAGVFARGALRAATPAPASVKVLNAWSRATPPGASVGVAYFEIVNSGAADALTGIESPVAERVEMHSVSMNGAVMQMRPVASVQVPAGARISFKPGGLHAMLIDLKQPLQQDQRFALTLLFEHAGRVRVEVLVQGF